MTTMLKKEFLEIYRSKKLLILLVILFFTAISSAIFAKLIPEILKNVSMPSGFVVKVPLPTWHDAIDQFIKNISQIVLIVVVLVFAGSVADEKSKKTLEIVLTKPISRVKFILAKFISSGAVLTAIYVVSATVFYFYSVSLFQSYSAVHFFYLALFTLIFILLILVITIFTSTLVGSQLLAAGLSFGIEVTLLAVLPLINSINKYLPVYTINHYKELMSNGQISSFLPSVFVTIGLIILLVITSTLIFKNQEVER